MNTNEQPKLDPEPSPTSMPKKRSGLLSSLTDAELAEFDTASAELKAALGHANSGVDPRDYVKGYPICRHCH